jgi:putative peptide zinc metalloprotease protein
MYIPLKNCFRQDLIITKTLNKDTHTSQFSIKNPTSGEIFEFGEEEYFLCKSMNGTASVLEIINSFKDSFGLSLTEEDFQGFSDQIAEFGLLEPLKPKNSLSSSVPLNSSQSLPHIPDIPSQALPEITPVTAEQSQRNPVEEKQLEQKKKKKNTQPKKGPIYLWPLNNPNAKFTVLASILKPSRQFFKLMIWSLIPGLPLAFYTFFNNQSLFWRYIASSVEALPYLTTYIFNVIFVSLTAKIAQAIICTYYGGRVHKFGLVLAAGFFPRFYCDRKGVWELNRKQQLWFFATPLLARLVYFVLGVLIWYWTHGTGTTLGTWSLLLAHASFLDFLLDACPLIPVDGYFFAVTYLRLPPNFLGRVYLIWEMVIKRRPLPQEFSLKEKLGMLLYGPIAVVFWLAMVLLLAFSIANGVAENFDGIFGRATTGIFITLFIIAALRQPLTLFFRKKSNTKTFDSPVLDREQITRTKKPNHWKKRSIQLFILACIAAILIIPYPYRPGGQIQLLPPTQQAIQAQVDGKIVKVMFKGGDGQWIKAGTVVATMEAVDIENASLTTQQKVKNQEAVVQREKAQLDKLLSTPRPEEVAVAKQQVAVAKQQVEVAKQQVEVAKQQVEEAKNQLNVAISKADFSSKEADRFEELYKGGAVSRQAFEDKKKIAETERLNIETSRQNLVVKQANVEEARNQVATRQQDVTQKQANLSLVLSGPHPEEIAAARKELEAAKAELGRQQQQFKYEQEQLQRTQLIMPLDGRLITSYLDQKVGSYLKQGNTFAVAEDDRYIRGEVRIPEYNVGEFNLGAWVEIKLLAYPNRPFRGKVSSIEPAASAQNASSTTTNAPTSNLSERFIRVIVDIPNSEEILKASMTGYAKIDGSTKPLVVAFTRPIVRFIQIEIWSWLP